jgi:hypothetical protein
MNGSPYPRSPAIIGNKTLRAREDDRNVAFDVELVLVLADFFFYEWKHWFDEENQE